MSGLFSQQLVYTILLTAGGIFIYLSFIGGFSSYQGQLNKDIKDFGGMMNSFREKGDTEIDLDNKKWQHYLQYFFVVN